MIFRLRPTSASVTRARAPRALIGERNVWRGSVSCVLLLIGLVARDERVEMAISDLRWMMQRYYIER